MTEKGAETQAAAADQLPVSETRPSLAAADQPAADPDAALTIAPEAQAIADRPAEPTPTATAVVRPAQRYVAKAPVVKRRVARTERHHGYSGAYAQYGGGWSGWPGLGGPYHF
jgi:hypothetical protein